MIDKVGRLREGYEASFLVLVGDRIQDFRNIKKMKLRIKQGQAVGSNKPYYLHLKHLDKNCFNSYHSSEIKPV